MRYALIMLLGLMQPAVAQYTWPPDENGNIQYWGGENWETADAESFLQAFPWERKWLINQGKHPKPPGFKGMTFDEFVAYYDERFNKPMVLPPEKPEAH